MNYLNFRLTDSDSIYVAPYLATGFHRRVAISPLIKQPESKQSFPAKSLADIKCARMRWARLTPTLCYVGVIYCR